MRRVIFALLIGLIAAASTPARADPGPTVAVRTESRPGFGRVAFDFPSRVRFSVAREGERVTIEFTSPLTVGSPAALPRNVSSLKGSAGRAEIVVATGAQNPAGASRQPHHHRCAGLFRTVALTACAGNDAGRRSEHGLFAARLRCRSRAERSGRDNSPPERSGRESGAARRGAIALDPAKTRYRICGASRRPPCRCPPARCPDRSPSWPERSNPRPAAPDGPSPCRSSRPSGRRLFAGAGPCWWCSMSGGRSIWPNSVQIRP